MENKGYAFIRVEEAGGNSDQISLLVISFH